MLSKSLGATQEVYQGDIINFPLTVRNVHTFDIVSLNFSLVTFFFVSAYIFPVHVGIKTYLFIHLLIECCSL